MSQDYNLPDVINKIQTEYVRKIVDMQDSAIYGFLVSAVSALESQGKDITKYALINVSSPMEYKNNGMRVNSQWRIVPISDLSNIPVYED